MYNIRLYFNIRSYNCAHLNVFACVFAEASYPPGDLAFGCNEQFSGIATNLQQLSQRLPPVQMEDIAVAASQQQFPLLQHTYEEPTNYISLPSANNLLSKSPLQQ